MTKTITFTIEAEFAVSEDGLFGVDAIEDAIHLLQEHSVARLVEIAIDPIDPPKKGNRHE